MASYTRYRIEDYEINHELYEHLKDLYRLVEDTEGNLAIRNTIKSIVKRYCVDLEDFLNDMKYEDKVKERESNSEVDADKFFKDHFVFTTVKM